MSIPLHLKRTQAGVTVSVHPLVPLIVCDAYTRRNKGTDRVLGTILGTVSENEYHVTNCFVVPHTETGSTVTIDTSHHQTLLELHQKVYPKELVLGWFSSNHSLQSVDGLIQEFYSTLVPNPIHLAIDALLENENEVKVMAQVSRSLFLKGSHLATEFVEVACHLKMELINSVGMHLLQKNTVEKIDGSSENLLSTLRKLTKLVDGAYEYADSVVVNTSPACGLWECSDESGVDGQGGERQGDAVIGRYLMDTLSIVPFIDREKFKKLLGDRVQEMTLVVYLSTLCKAQIAIADKLANSQM